MLESLDPDLACHRGAPDKTPERRLATLDAAGRLAVPFTTGVLVGIGESRPERVRTLSAIADSHRAHGHVQEVIVQNFLPKPGTAMHDHPPCPPEELLWTIAVARLVLPADVHVQAPPNLSDDLRPLLDSGLDDWGGVSPVTVDHVNPERAWPALALLREATEAAGMTLAARLTIYPGYASDPERGSTPPCASRARRSDADDLGREDPGARGASSCPGAGGRPSRRPRRHRWGRPACGRRVASAAAPWPRCSTAWPRARRWARTRSSPCSRRAAPRFAPWPRWPTSCGGTSRRRRHVGGQPQHQLHQRVHLQVQVLRLLQRPPVAQPAGRRPTSWS